MIFDGLSNTKHFGERILHADDGRVFGELVQIDAPSHHWLEAALHAVGLHRRRDKPNQRVAFCRR
jgi:hypothetical protein